MKGLLACPAGLLLAGTAMAQSPNVDELLKGAGALKKGSTSAVDERR